MTQDGRLGAEGAPVEGVDPALEVYAWVLKHGCLDLAAAASDIGIQVPQVVRAVSRLTETPSA